MRDQPLTPDEEREAEEMLAGMDDLTEEWLPRLQDPATQTLIEQGVLRVSPLVTRLLKAVASRHKNTR